MKLDFTGERVLAMVAHPDDAELLCAGTLARARADGAAIGIAVLCQGDKGRPAKPMKHLAAMRKKEMLNAAKLLGAKCHFGGVPDSELADDPAQRKIATELLRLFRPTLVIAHHPADYHADHRAAFALAAAAGWSSASHGYRTASKPLAAPPAIWIADTINALNCDPGFFVDVTAHLPLKRRMLACHKSQLLRGDDGDFSPLDEMLVRQASMRGAQAGVKAAEAFAIYPAWKRLRAW